MKTMVNLQQRYFTFALTGDFCFFLYFISNKRTFLTIILLGFVMITGLIALIYVSIFGNNDQTNPNKYPSNSIGDWLYSNGIKKEELTYIQDECQRDNFPWDHVLPCRVATEEEVHKTCIKHVIARKRGSKATVASSCPLCLKENVRSRNIIWVFFDSPAETWKMGCGKDGYLSICTKHKIQIDFWPIQRRKPEPIGVVRYHRN